VFALKSLLQGRYLIFLSNWQPLFLGQLEKRAIIDMTIENAALAQGSVVLITGVNGLVGSHVADQVLLHGYKVRGTVRNAEKNSWMVDFFAQRYGKGKFELVEIPDLTTEGAFTEAVKGKIYEMLTTSYALRLLCCMAGLTHLHRHEQE